LFLPDEELAEKETQDNLGLLYMNPQRQQCEVVLPLSLHTHEREASTRKCGNLRLQPKGDEKD
jgi:hypothetical protein